MSDARADPPPTEGFMYELCKSERTMRLAYLLMAAGAGLMVAWLVLATAVPSLNPGQGAYVVATLNLVVLGSTAAVMAVLTRKCVTRKRLRHAAYRAESDDSAGNSPKD